MDQAGNRASFSATGPEAVLAAPAVDMVSTAPGGGYAKSSGTSDATAIIAGVAALVRSKFPELTAAEVIHRMTATATDRGPPGRDDEYGYGIVNPLAALTADVPPLAASSSVRAPGTGSAEQSPSGDGDTNGSVLIGLLIGAVLLGAAGVGAAVAIGRARQGRG